MPNVVEIVVKSRDEASPGLHSARTNAKLAGSEGGSAMDSLGGKIKGMGAAALAAAAVIGVELAKKAIGALIDYTKASIEEASNLNESVNAVDKIFKGSSKTVQDWGKKNAEAFGLSVAEFNKMATPMGALLQGLGFSAANAADKTITLTKRAADLASVFNTDVPTAVDALTSALKGEFDPIEQFGVHLNAAMIQAEALRETHKKSASELTDNQKAMAAYNLILQQTNSSAGDFQQTATGLANSQRILDARTKDVEATFGEKFLPVMQQINQLKLQALEYIANTVLPAVEAATKLVIEKFDYVWQQAAPKLQELLEAVKQAWEDNKDSIEKLKPLLEYLGVALGVTLVAALIVVGGLIGALIVYLGQAGDAFVQLRGFVDKLTLFVLESFGHIVDAAAAAFGWIPGVGEKIKAAQAQFHSATDGIINDIKAAHNAASTGINVAIKVTGLGDLAAAGAAISRLVGSQVVSVGLGHKAAGGIGNGLTEVGEHGRELVRLPTGSMVYPEANANQMAHNAGGSGTVVNIYVQGSIRSDRELVKLIKDEFQSGGFRGVVGAAA